jgi:hypothetical protein
LEPDNLEYLRAAVAQYFHLPSANVQVERFCRGELTMLVVYPAEGQTEQQQFVKLVESSADSMLSAKTEGGAVSMEVCPSVDSVSPANLIIVGRNSIGQQSVFSTMVMSALSSLRLIVSRANIHFIEGSSDIRSETK